MQEGSAMGNTDENAIARRFYRLLYANDSPWVETVRNIPGFRFAPHLALSLGAEYLRTKAGGIFPGDDRPIIRALRLILQHTAPALEGIGDADADVMESRIDSAVDMAKGSTTSATPQKGLLDLVRVWFVDGKAVLIIPVISSDGRVQMDSRGVPIPSNLSPALMSRWLSEEFTKGKTRQVRNQNGKGSREVSVPPITRDLTDEIGLTVALGLLGGPEGLTPDQVERLEQLLRAEPSWESRISPDVDDVLSWLIDVHSLAALNITALERQEIEDLVQKMKTQQPEPEWVNRRLGRFRKETNRFPPNGRRTYDDTQLGRIRTLRGRIRDEIDITLGGEQSLATKARKGLQAAPDILDQVGKVLSGSAPWLMKWFRWWRLAVIIAFVLLLLGILVPVARIGIPFWTLVTFICAVTGGIIGFAITWPFPLIQKVYDYLQTFIAGYSVDSINSLGRRIASFALCMGAGVLPLTIWLEFPVFVRAGIVTFGGLFPIGIMFALREAGYPDLAQRLVKRSLLIANFVFGTLAVATMVLVGGIASYTGKFMTGPQFLKGAFDRSVNGAGHVGSWFSGFTTWYLATEFTASTLWRLGAIIAIGLVLVLILTSLFGGSKEKGTSDRATTVLGMLLGVALFLGVIGGVGWGVIAGIKGIGNWFHDDPAPTAQTVEAPASTGKKPTRKELCDQNKVDYATCRDWGYKK